MIWFIAALGAAILCGVAGQLLLKEGAGAADLVSQLFRPTTIIGLGFYVLAALLYIATLVGLSQETPTGTLIRRYLERLGVAVEPVVSSEDVETAKRMVEMGIGAAFLPDMVTERDVATQANPGGPLSRLAVDPPLTRRIVLVTWDEVPSSRAMAAFLEEVRRQSSTWPGAVKSNV